MIGRKNEEAITQGTKLSLQQRLRNLFRKETPPSPETKAESNASVSQNPPLAPTELSLMGKARFLSRRNTEADLKPPKPKKVPPKLARTRADSAAPQLVMSCEEEARLREELSSKIQELERKLEQAKSEIESAISILEKSLVAEEKSSPPPQNYSIEVLHEKFRTDASLSRITEQVQAKLEALKGYSAVVSRLTNGLIQINQLPDLQGQASLFNYRESEWKGRSALVINPLEVRESARSLVTTRNSIQKKFKESADQEYKKLWEQFQTFKRSITAVLDAISALSRKIKRSASSQNTWARKGSLAEKPKTEQMTQSQLVEARENIESLIAACSREHHKVCNMHFQFKTSFGVESPSAQTFDRLLRNQQNELQNINLNKNKLFRSIEGSPEAKPEVAVTAPLQDKEEICRQQLRKLLMDAIHKNIDFWHEKVTLNYFGGGKAIQIGYKKIPDGLVDIYIALRQNKLTEAQIRARDRVKRATSSCCSRYNFFFGHGVRDSVTHEFYQDIDNLNDLSQITPEAVLELAIKFQDTYELKLNLQEYLDVLRPLTNSVRMGLHT